MTRQTLLSTSDRLLSFFFLEQANAYLVSPEEYLLENERSIVLARRIRNALIDMQTTSPWHASLLALAYEPKRHETPIAVTFGVELAGLVAPCGYDMRTIRTMIAKGDNRTLSGIRTSIGNKLAQAKLTFLNIYLSQNPTKDTQ